LLRAEDDLLDEGELDHVHADLRIDDGAQRVEDGELGGPRLRVDSRGGCLGRDGNLISHVGYGNASTGRSGDPLAG
jgi:hypothetical protein